MRTDPILRVFYRASSGNRLSRSAAILADIPLPKLVMRRLVSSYCRAFRVDMRDVVVPAGGFRTFNDFFTRRLKPGARLVDASQDTVVAPSDGRLLARGTVVLGDALMAKGRPYRVAELLGDEELASTVEGGPYVTIYLSPRDYHRVHFPCDGEVVRAIYVPGRLYTVAPRAVNTVDRLLVRNERMTTVMNTAFGTLIVTMVGASFVGRISLSFWEATTNSGQGTAEAVFDPPVRAVKGSDLGVFNMGSTVVMFLAPGGWEWRGPEVGSAVMMGSPLLTSRQR